MDYTMYQKGEDYISASASELSYLLPLIEASLKERGEVTIKYEYLCDLIDEDNYNYCYECQGYGDDYYIGEDGDLLCACDDCVHNEFNWEDGCWKDDI